ncbi:hypothetical protein KP509_36G063600 [Ceratopteris richardii]|uniref:Phytocyanin domain-containing protein n=1 Tax=Ceratopteris richardii TaxID=49495 RepID=A0A8T2QDP3_CERRI|nr:hypothetical protein KP509_36G063600 [Ceratopteris richardii]
MVGWGRGSAHSEEALTAASALAAVMLVLSSCMDQAHAATHRVGGSQGWDLSVDYASWAAGQSFTVGDVLFFPYTKTEHDVVVVDKAGYAACSAEKPIASLNNGNDNITLSAAGTHYYICSVVGHCSGGMKLAVTVAAGAPSPKPTAVPTAVPSPSPSPSPSPFSSPAPGSSSAPVEPPASSPSPTSLPPAISPLSPSSIPSEASASSPLSPTAGPPPPTAGPPPPPSSPDGSAAAGHPAFVVHATVISTVALFIAVVFR